MAHIDDQNTPSPASVPPDPARPIVKAPWTLGRVWRLLVTGFSFLLFGFGGILLAFIWFPLINLFVWNKEKRARIAQASVHKIWWLYVRIMRVIGVLTWSIDDIARLRDCRGTIVVANHPSLLDVVFLMAHMEATRAVVKEGVWKHPFMAGVVRSANYIPNMGDPEKLVESCADALRDGANLLIFPEGSRTPIGKKARYQRGFAHIALAAGAPIMMVTIETNTPTLRKGEPWYSIPVVKGHWTIRVHDVIDTPATFGDERSVANVRELTRSVQTRIEEELRI